MSSALVVLSFMLHHTDLELFIRLELKKQTGKYIELEEAQEVNRKLAKTFDLKHSS